MPVERPVGVARLLAVACVFLGIAAALVPWAATRCTTCSPSRRTSPAGTLTRPTRN